ncbi:phage portal protein [Carboxydothermus hydrogenoformans]|uniref:Putative prophage LambdaCh01, portal protein, SPP1 family n=1 Tax=Carboxydothermus hydrogenoformans (strain ATCC BAA-161 / DSM 6008 / Z-2901) TaxID=246194 RepID=Q3ABI5_CARHZ|nr:phage portal protein [Carboxydothermus hydrogenoformans]ABB14225.1 putative prophage LambdaCh01, portal protein, SPP1 family [Carboxydothermus hydrogenoformans Z-2901]
MILLTSLDFLAVGHKWPPPTELERLQLYDNNRKLFEGKHDQVYSQWIKLLRNDQAATLEIILNWPKRLSTLWADLLLGEPPRISAGDRNSPEQQNLERLIKENQLYNVGYEVVLDTSRFGTGLFKVRYDKRGIIEAQQPAVWFPVVKPENVKEIVAHVLAYVVEETASTLLGEKKQQYLIAEIHEKGKITTRRYALKDGRIAGLLEEEEVLTGVDDFLIVPVNNIVTSDRVHGIDDYSDLDSIIQELEIRVAQISRILDKHADPNMYGPDTALEQDPKTGEWSFRGGGKYFPVGPDEKPPGYVTWDGQLEAAFKHIEILMEQLYILSETSPAAFGQLKAGLAESGSALRRLMMAPLAKVNRIRMRFDPALKKVLRLASELEVAQGKPGAVKLENIEITWNDGLPQDDKEQAEIHSILVQNGLESRETAIRRLFQFEADTLREELMRITAEANAQVPLVFKPTIQQPEQITPSNAGGEE